MQNLKIAFIGAGNMASALAEGILQKKIIAPKKLYMVDRNQSKRDRWQEEGAKVFASAQDIFGKCEVIFLAIKPQGLKDFFNENRLALKANISDLSDKNRLALKKANKPSASLAKAPLEFSKKSPLIISILAGTSIKTLESFFVNLPIIRLMPNLPARIGFGMSGACANSRVSDKSKDLVDFLLKSSGASIWVDENQIDGVTAISGSGPAYFFYIFELMQKKAQALGFSEAQARELVLNTALGATQMALSSDKPAEDLKNMVISKGGTTFAAIESLKEANLKLLLAEAIDAALTRAEELSKI